LSLVETNFSKAIAYPTILVQGYGSEDSRRAGEPLSKPCAASPKSKTSSTCTSAAASWRRSIFRAIGRTRSASTAASAKPNPRTSKSSKPPAVSSEGAISAVIQSDVRSFKEGEVRRKQLEESLKMLDLPEARARVSVTRHPKRNFAMVEADIHSYQEAELLTAELQNRLHKLDLPVKVRITGLPALFYDLNREAVAALNKAEWIGIPACFLVLMWVFGSRVAALLPIVVAMATLLASSAIMSKIGKHIEISLFVPSVLSMIGLGVGVDYMLILVSRFRECMAKHTHVEEAIMEAMHLAAPTLLGSAFTVTIGFSALAFTPVTLFRAMGIAGIVVI